MRFEEIYIIISMYNLYRAGDCVHTNFTISLEKVINEFSLEILNMPGDPIQHYYTELPDCYLMDVTLEWAQNQYGTYVSKRAIILVDKRTGRGGFVQFVNDKVGNLPTDNAAFLFNNGYFMQSIEPGELALRIDEALSSPGGLTLKQQDELKSLRASINEDDNTYLFVGKLK